MISAGRSRRVRMARQEMTTGARLTSLAGRIRREALANDIQFGERDLGVFFGSVPREPPPHASSDHTDDGAEPESGAPAVMEDEPCEQWRGEAAACADSGEDEPVDEPTFLLRYPAGDELVGRRINHRFAGAQRETDADEQQYRLGNARGYQCGKGGGHSPPHHSQRNHQPRTKAGGEPPGGDLKTGIANEKRAEDPPQPLVSEPVFRADLESRDGNIGAVEERDGAENEKPECEEKSLPGVAFCNIDALLLRMRALNT